MPLEYPVKIRDITITHIFGDLRDAQSRFGQHIGGCLDPLTMDMLTDGSARYSPQQGSRIARRFLNDVPKLILGNSLAIVNLNVFLHTVYMAMVLWRHFTAIPLHIQMNEGLHT
ncbi:hypothetical protein D1872_241260 [compost metagenome]